MKFFFVALSFFIGLWLLNGDLLLMAIVSILFLFFLLYRFGKKWDSVFAIIFLLGVGVSQIKISTHSEVDTFKGVVIETKENYFLFQSRLEKFYVYEKGNSKEVGDILEIYGKKETNSFTHIEMEFDFGKYLDNKGVYSTLTIYKENFIFDNFIELKAYRNYYLSFFNDESKTLVNALLFSSKNYDSDAIKNAKSSSLIFLLSVSGIYVSTLLKGLTYLLSRKLKEKWAKLFAFIILSFYFVLAFPKFAILRISLLFLMRWINDYLLKKKFSYLEIVAISAIIFLLFDYHYAYQEGFILGYGIIIYIYFIREILNRWNVKQRKYLFPIAIFFFLLPVTISSNNGFNLLGIFVQIILIPVFTLFIIVGVIGLYSYPLYFIINPFSSLINTVLKATNTFKIGINIPSFTSWGFLLYYVILIIFFLCLEIKHIRFNKYLSLLFVLFMLIYSLPIQNRVTEEVSFVNVGQGDCTLLRVGSHTLLIDTGGNVSKDIADVTLVPYLKSKRIYSLDFVIATHEDYDHIGAYSSLTSLFNVKNYVIEKNKFPIEFCGITISNLNLKTYEETNDNSNVLYFKACNKYFMIMGDAPIKVEKDIVNTFPSLEADVLKVGHHGSDTSTCKEFLSQYSFTDAIISVGKNSYGHPAKSVVTLLTQYVDNIYRTDKNGTITYQSWR